MILSGSWRLFLEALHYQLVWRSALKIGERRNKSIFLCYVKSNPNNYTWISREKFWQILFDSTYVEEHLYTWYNKIRNVHRFMIQQYGNMRIKSKMLLNFYNAWKNTILGIYHSWNLNQGLYNTQVANKRIFN